MPKTHIDCRKAELDLNNIRKGDFCKWCGRCCKYTHNGKFVHRRGYKRMIEDPRKKK